MARQLELIRTAETPAPHNSTVIRMRRAPLATSPNCVFLTGWIVSRQTVPAEMVSTRGHLIPKASMVAYPRYRRPGDRRLCKRDCPDRLLRERTRSIEGFGGGIRFRCKRELQVDQLDGVDLDDREATRNRSVDADFPGFPAETKRPLGKAAFKETSGSLGGCSIRGPRCGTLFLDGQYRRADGDASVNGVTVLDFF